jgi:hypothetical protein
MRTGMPRYRHMVLAAHGVLLRAGTVLINGALSEWVEG